MKRHPNRKINRRNYRDTRRYLEYCEVIRQNTAGTISAKRAAIDHLLRWATDVSLTRAAKLRPTFPQYIGQLELSPDYQNKIFSYARRFFVYAQNQWQERY